LLLCALALLVGCSGGGGGGDDDDEDVAGDIGGIGGFDGSNIDVTEPDTVDAGCVSDEQCGADVPGLCYAPACNLATGVCGTKAAPFGKACDDDDPCTDADRCVGGDCAGLPFCDDDNPCTDDSCDDGGACVHTPNKSTCSDGDPCTKSDVCAGGSCAGVPKDCDDGNVCTDDGCDPDVNDAAGKPGACVSLPNKATCDDGDACTEGDGCVDAACAATPVDCDDGDVCTVDACAKDGSGCTHQHLGGGAPCDDGDPCTEGDACGVGQGPCAGVPKPCDDANQCTDDVCVDGVCGHSLSVGPCDDGSQCTTGDTCQQGSCVGVSVVCQGTGICVVGACDPVAGCSTAPAPGKPCNDGQACTGDDQCDANGECKGTTDACDDGNACTDDFCVGGQQCLHSVLLGDCQDEQACVLQGTCVQGKCEGAPLDCDDGDPCTSEVCLPGQGCVATVALGVTCDDGDDCTIGDTCTADGCVGSDVGCDDGNPCTDNGCLPGGACLFTANAQPCDDGTACTKDDTCSGGACLGALVTCDDGDACTADTCDTALGCVHGALIGTACDDGAGCTGPDRCQPDGSCVGKPRVCGDGDVCTTDACDPATGACVFSAAPDGTACDDGNACTTDDACDGGSCKGDALVCPGGGTGKCNTAQCDPQQGCIYTPVNDGKACTDPYPHTIGDVCQAGQCKGTGYAFGCQDNSQCNGIDPCMLGSCVNQFCKAKPLIDGDACDDGDPCTEADTCSGGVCAGAPKACDDGKACTVDACDVLAGGCIFTLAPAPGDGALPCDDGDACTATDICLDDGTCAGDGVDCDDGQACTDDTCDPAAGCVHLPTEATCTDGDACTTGDVCTVAGCVGTPVVCNDGNVCTTDTCDGQGGCVFPAVSGAPACAPDMVCAGLLCTAVEVPCEGGKDGAPCPLGQHCTVDGCKPDALGQRVVSVGGAVVQIDGVMQPDALVAPGSTALVRYVCPAGTRSVDGACRECGEDAHCPSTHVCEHFQCVPGGQCTGDADCAPFGTKCNEQTQRCVACETTLDCPGGQVCEANVCKALCSGELPCAQGTCINNICQACTWNGDCGGDTPYCDFVSKACVACQFDGNCPAGHSCVGQVCLPDVCASGDGQVCLDSLDGDAEVTQLTCKQGAGLRGPDDTPGKSVDGGLATEFSGLPVLICGGGCNTSLCGERGSGAVDVDNAPLAGCGLKNPSGAGAPCFDDLLDCTADQCNLQGGCSHTLLPGTCLVDGVCYAQGEGDATGCKVCQPAASTDVLVQLPDGAFCEDGNPCTTGSKCTNKACGGGVPADIALCEDGSPCTWETCDPVQGCLHHPVGDGLLCGAATPCTLPGICQSGTCIDGGEKDCADGDPCTADSCEPTSGCVNVAGGVDCDDGNPCSKDACTPGKGCTHKPAFGPCDDGNPCTVGDSCNVAMKCVSGAPTPGCKPP
jgi:hypothetical protein